VTAASTRPIGLADLAGQRLAVGVVLLAGAVGALAGTLGMLAVVGVAALALTAAIAVHPPLAGWLLIGATPLLVGIDRGVVLPLLRPNEALLALAIGGLAVRGVGHLMSGRPIRFQITAVEVAIVAMAVTSSVTPLLWMLGTGREVVLDDLLYASTLWKYLALFLVIRYSIRTAAQVSVALKIALAAGVVVGVVAVLQSMGLFGVPELLERWYAPSDVEGLFAGRGTSTLSSSIAVGDVMAFLLAVVIAMLARSSRHRVILASLGVIFILGAVGSGQFSGVIALAVAAIVAAVLAGQLRRLVTIGLPTAAVVGLALWPVIETRLAGFQTQAGLPQSWTARLENLGDFFWPTLFSDFNWVLGVRPSARVPAPEVWRDWVFIESGHTWLLWNGGVPLLVAFTAFVVVALRSVWSRAGRPDAIGVAATASAAALVVLAVLMLFDPHLTMRGTADMSFVLLALALTGVGRCHRSTDRAHAESTRELERTIQ
jgi:hypothetical protein